MTLISDILMIAGALGAAFYCVVLSRRLTRFTNLENGMGGAIAVLSAQVDGMTRTLKAAQLEAGASGRTLEELTRRAEDVARRLELNVAAMHDLPDPETTGSAASGPEKEPPMAFRRPTSEPEAKADRPAPAPKGAPEPEAVPMVTASPPVRSFFSNHRQAPSLEAAE